MVPVAVVGLAGLLLVARRVDALALGDDAARGLGVPVRATRVTAVVLATLLSAAAVTLAGPIGFVGLCAPALVRPLARRLRGFLRLRAAVPVAGLVGAALVLGADVLLRAFVAADTAVAVPTGVVTSLLGAAFLVVMAARLRDTAGAAAPDKLRIRSRRVFLTTLTVLVVALVGVTIAAVLLGDSKLLLGDVVNWAQGRAGRTVSFVLDTRTPRVLGALLAGAALALAGTLVQAVTRNPLAEPSVLGVSGGGALGAVILVTTVPAAGAWGVAGAAFAGSAVTAVVVFGLAARGGFQQNRLVLVGIGVATATTALISLLIVLTDPFNATKALTWLSGSTYGRTLPDVLPLAGVLAAGIAVAAVRHRELDLVSLDEDTPRLLGLDLGRGRLGFLRHERAAHRHRRGRRRHHRLRRPGRPARGTGPRRTAAHPRRAGRAAARRRAGVHGGPAGPHGDRTGPAGRRAHDGRDRNAVLPPRPGAQPPVGRARPGHRGSCGGRGEERPRRRNPRCPPPPAVPGPACGVLSRRP
ncbi:Vitamin B12 import system permease protein BtuC [Streptomyces griseomycini]